MAPNLVPLLTLIFINLHRLLDKVPFTALGGDWGESHIYKYAGGAFNFDRTDVNAVFQKLPSGAMVEQFHWYHVVSETPTECTDPNHHGMTPPVHVCTKTSTYLLYITSINLPSDIYADVYEWYSGYGGYVKSNSDYYIDGSKFNPMPSGSGVWIHTNDRDNPFTGNQQACDDYEAHLIDPCFIAGTQVQYDLLGHTKNIEDFKVGDQIVSYNVNTNKLLIV